MMWWLFCWIYLLAGWQATRAQSRYDVIINEIMPDPTPVTGLPAVEWIELQNRSSTPINLEGWTLHDKTSTSSPFRRRLLNPGELLILCAASSVPLLSSFGPVMDVTRFPSLDNEDDLLYLSDSNGNVIHGLHYRDAWYDNALKKNGGWSLELMDNHQPCLAQSNWSASNDPTGGTPGRTNSITQTLPPRPKPAGLLKTFITNDSTISLLFDYSLTNDAHLLTQFTLDRGLRITAARTMPPLFDRIEIMHDPALLPGDIYTLSIQSLQACQGNTPVTTSRIGHPQPASFNDCVINEILFNPIPGNDDYVEIYNRSDQIIDFASLHLANRAADGTIANLVRLSEEPHYLLPGDFAVVSPDRDRLLQQFAIEKPVSVVECGNLPSYPDDKGTVVLLNNAGDIVDELSYNASFHFPLVTSDEGISLERIHPDITTQRADNWTSATASTGFGTPTKRNGAYALTGNSARAFAALPKTFSPDNDGLDDATSITCNLAQPGFVGTIRIFDCAGRQIRIIANNELVGANATWRWNGTDDQNRVQRPGIYIVHGQFFTATGLRKTFRETVVLAPRR